LTPEAENIVVLFIALIAVLRWWRHLPNVITWQPLQLPKWTFAALMARISTLDNIGEYEILWLTATPTQYSFLRAARADS